MKLNKNLINALLYCMYVAHAGRATTETIAGYYNLSHTFLDQIARKLRIAGVLKSIRGPNGGYELNGTPTFADVLTAMGASKFLTFDEHQALARGTAEERALDSFLLMMNVDVYNKFKVEFKKAIYDSAKKEGAKLNTLNETSSVN